MNDRRRVRTRRRRAGGAARFSTGVLQDAAFAFLVMGAMLAIGSVHGTTLLVMTGLALASLALVREPLGSPGPTLLCLAVSGYCCLQAIPLPLGLVRKLSPQSAALHADALAPFGSSTPSWVSLSIDRGETLFVALSWVLYGIVALHAQQVAVRRGSKSVRDLVFVSGVVLAVLAVGHTAFSIKSVYGLYRPTFVTDQTIYAPLLNPNNLAGYLNLSLFCGLGPVLDSRRSAQRSLRLAGLALLVGQSLVTGSRGGALTLMLGLLSLPFILDRRSLSPAILRRASAVALVLVAGVAFAFLAAFDSLADEFRNQSAEKLVLNEWAWSVIRLFPVTGTGAGAFQSAVSVAGASGPNTFFSHPENFVTGWLAEFGVLPGSALLAGLWWLFRVSQLKTKRSIGRGCATVGLWVLAVHNLVDLGFTVPGVMVAAIALASGLRGKRRDSRPLRLSLFGREIAPYVWLGGFGIAVCGFSLTHGLRSNVAARGHIASLERTTDWEDSAARQEFKRELRSTMLRHPGDVYFPRIGALHASHLETESLPWIARALTLSPQDGRTHFLLAHILARRGVNHQALLELRLASTYSPDLRRKVVPFALTLTRDPAQLKRVVPEGVDGTRVLTELARLLDRDEEWQTSVELVREAIERDPHASEPYQALLGRLLDALERSNSNCAERRQACLKESGQALERLRAMSTPSESFATAQARYFALVGKHEEAVRVLEEYCPAQDTGCLSRAILISVAGDLPIEDLSRSYIAIACTEDSKCAEAHRWIARREIEKKKYGSAVIHFEKAAEVEQTAEAWLMVARVAHRRGMRAKARLALNQAEKLGAPGGVIEDLRRQISESAPVVEAP